MSEPNPATDKATANPSAGGTSFAGWLISTVFWPLVRLSFGTGANSYEVDDAPGQRFPVKVCEIAPITWTQTIVTLTAADSAPLIAGNAARRALRWMVTGTNPMTVAPGAGAVIAGSGMNYSAPLSAGQQGGSDSFAGELSQQAFSAISTLGTTVVVWEGA